MRRVLRRRLLFSCVCQLLPLGRPPGTPVDTLGVSTGVAREDASEQTTDILEDLPDGDESRHDDDK